MKTVQQSFLKLNEALGVQIYLKREDQHKYGSHKGRSIPHMIKKYLKEDGIKNFVISSSGNAALAAIYAVQAHNRNNPEKISLNVFVGQHIEPQKMKLLLSMIEDPKVKIEQVERPKQTAITLEKAGDTKNLRQSTDDIALIGYYELADELNRIPNLQAIFIPTSSGTTAQALGEAFGTLEASRWGGKQNPQIHIVQTTACHPLAEVFDTNFSKTETSCAGAIVDKVALRKEKIIEMIKKTEGAGWVVDDMSITYAQQLIDETCNIKCSPNAALSIAGLQKALEQGKSWDGVVVCLLTGL